MNINNKKEVKGRHVTMAQAYDNFLKAMNGSTSFTTIDRCGKDCKNIFCAMIVKKRNNCMASNFYYMLVLFVWRPS
jgi:hypothetical protein